VSDDIEAMGVQQRSVFIRVQTRVIERFASKLAHRDPMGGPTRKHQCRTRRRMRPENRKHLTLILRTEVKKAVPGQDAFECVCWIDNVRMSAIRQSSLGKDR
jgi:hypothetical protein